MPPLRIGIWPARNPLGQDRAIEVRIEVLGVELHEEVFRGYPFRENPAGRFYRPIPLTYTSPGASSARSRQGFPALPSDTLMANSTNFAAPMRSFGNLEFAVTPLATHREPCHKIQIVKEIDHPIAVEVCARLLPCKRTDKIQIVEQIDGGIAVQIQRTEASIPRDIV